MTATPEGLRRELGFWEVTASGVGIIVGAGIYVLIGAATAEAGASVWIAFLLAAGLSLLTGLSYAELSAMFPRAAAEYEYTRQAFPEWLAFLVGWVMIAGLAVAAGAVSLGFARYLGHFGEIPARAGAVGLLCLVAGIAMLGIKNSARITVLLSLIQVGGLLYVVFIGLPHVGDRDLVGDADAGRILGAAALVFFAFIGFDEVITLSEETRNPARTVPRALLAALGISTALYVGVAVVSVSVIGAEALGASDRPLADVMAHALGGRAVDAVAVIAILTTTNTTLLALTAASRLSYGMSAAGAFPRAWSIVSGRTGAPQRTILLCAVVAGGFALLGDLTLIASVTDFAVYLVFLAVNAGVIVLRFRQPGTARPFRVPGAVGRVPVLPLLGFGSVVVMITQLDERSLAIGGVLTIVGLGAAWLSGQARKRAIAVQ